MCEHVYFCIYECESQQRAHEKLRVYVDSVCLCIFEATCVFLLITWPVNIVVCEIKKERETGLKKGGRAQSLGKKEREGENAHQRERKKQKERERGQKTGTSRGRETERR